MNEDDLEILGNLLTIKQFAKKNAKLNRWPSTESALRGIYWKRNSNGMEDAFFKIANRILVDEDQFYKKKN